MKESAKTTHRRDGDVFEVVQVNKMFTQEYRTDIDPSDKTFLSFAEFLQYHFIIRCFLLAALRSVNFNRFRRVGVRHAKHGSQLLDGHVRPKVDVTIRIARTTDRSLATGHALTPRMRNSPCAWCARAVDTVYKKHMDFKGESVLNHVDRKYIDQRQAQGVDLGVETERCYCFYRGKYLLLDQSVSVCDEWAICRG